MMCPGDMFERAIFNKPHMACVLAKEHSVFLMSSWLSKEIGGKIW